MEVRIVSSRLVKSAQPQGAYRSTEVDRAKSHVEFCLCSINRRNNTIRWSDGRVENVTDSKLEKLQAAHVWTTDF
jgi:hypothetical protein